MKKILVATLLVALTSATFAGEKNGNVKLLTNLKTALKSVNESAWKTTDNYKKTSFAVNGKSVNAFVDPQTEELIGFSIAIDVNDLPEGANESIARKFKNWHISNAIMFIDAAGKTSYYTQVNKGKNNLALSISPKGKAIIYAKMPY